MEQLADFIREVDAEDGVVDGKLALDESKMRLRFVTGPLPGDDPGKPVQL